MRSRGLNSQRKLEAVDDVPSMRLRYFWCIRSSCLGPRCHTRRSCHAQRTCTENPRPLKKVVPSWASSWAFLRHTKVSQSERVVSWEPDPNFSRVLLSGKGVQNILALFVWQLNIFMEKVRFSIFHYQSWL